MSRDGLSQEPRVLVRMFHIGMVIQSDPNGVPEDALALRSQGVRSDTGSGDQHPFVQPNGLRSQAHFLNPHGQLECSHVPQHRFGIGMPRREVD